jgi:hypothetical protein
VAVRFIGGGNQNTRKNHRPVTSHWETLSHMLYREHFATRGMRTHNVSGIDCICRWHPSYIFKYYIHHRYGSIWCLYYFDFYYRSMMKFVLLISILLASCMVVGGAEPSDTGPHRNIRSNSAIHEEQEGCTCCGNNPQNYCCPSYCGGKK